MKIEDLLQQPHNRDAVRSLTRLIGQGVGVVPFVGAGMSIPFGFPGWRDFLLQSCNGSSVEEKIRQMLDGGQYEEAAEELYAFLEQGRFEASLRAGFGDSVLDLKLGKNAPAGAIAHLPDLAVGPIVTTNFDHLIERLFEKNGIGLSVMWGSDRLDSAMGALQRRQLFLLKLHGDVDDPRERILTLAEYRRAYGGTQPGDIQMDLPLPRLLGNILASRILLFLGCSLSADRTLRAMHAVARNYKSLIHFAVVEQPEEVEEFERRQRELSALNILGLWYPPRRHDLIDPLLAHLVKEVEKAGLRTARRRSQKEPQHNLLGKGEKSFIGRRRDMRRLQELLDGRRLVSIVGPGGCGKSELALRVAKSQLERFSDGVWLIELAPVQDESLIPQTIATTLGLQEQAQRPPTHLLADYLRPRTALLLLDNCEHVVRACREILRELLAKCPDLRVLATSRQRLALASEKVYRLGSLSLPDLQGFSTLDHLQSFEAVQLFAERARSSWDSFRITQDSARFVAEICLRLDGLPLAIELVAGRMATRSAEQVARDLAADRVFRLARNRHSDSQRQKSLFAAIRWSYDLLDEEQQRLLRRLSVFQGGWASDAMTAVCSSVQEDEFDLLDRLEDLVDLSLVVQEALRERRFLLLETIRQFGRKALREEGEEEAVQRRHAEWFLKVAEQAMPQLLLKDQKRWLERLDTERDNLREAMRWSLQVDEEEMTLRLRRALWRFWEIRGYYREGRQRLGEILERTAPETHPSAYAEALSGLGLIAYRQGDTTEAAHRFEAAYDLQKTLDDDGRLADCLNDLGLIRRLRGQLEESVGFYRQCLELKKKAGDKRGQAVAHFNTGDVLVLMDRIQEGEPHLQESLNLFQAQGNLRDSAFPSKTLGHAALRRGDQQAARKRFQESLQRFEETGDQRGMGECHCGLAWVDLGQQALPDAAQNLSRAFALHKSIQNQRGLIRCLELLALLLHRQGDPLCILFRSATDQLREASGLARPPLYRPDLEAMLQEARKLFPAKTFQEMQRSGAEVSLEEALQSWTLEESQAGGEAAAPE